MKHMMKMAMGIAAVAAIATAAVAAEKHRFGAIFLNDAMMRVTDLDSIASVGSYRRATSTSIYFEPQQLGSSGPSFVFLTTTDEVDCSANQSRAIHGAAYDDQLGTVQESDLDGQFKPMASGSAGDAVIQTVCGRHQVSDDEIFNADLLTLRAALLKVHNNGK